MVRVAGIDEAGKGPVIGPMVVCGVCCSEEELVELEKIGVRDSKRLSPKRREELAREIKKLSNVYVIKLEPEKLDRLMEKKTINEILTDCYAEIINELNPDLTFVDSPDVIPERLSEALKKRTGKEVKAMHRADVLKPVVSAASIVAKVERDREIEKIKKELGVDFGSGYASDKRTIEFLKEYFKEHGRFPPYVRRSWKTLDRICQQSLEDFF
ncbi:ribonuclease HII [Archaeoglobus veneficus]|uniref:Ribonuclease HII n=1 Tax=Archaeoglobus veneficus (strain DSM 11195 / SNP6) TaxID=693661 RepID=F2KMP2_ARCVS|nr:ribonuclease HII [Archaeoglobus veneficus]AEA47239.1 ribonuclease HII [Archaeoglobus veneficus SNP6]